MSTLDIDSAIEKALKPPDDGGLDIDGAIERALSPAPQGLYGSAQVSLGGVQAPPTPAGYEPAVQSYVRDNTADVPQWVKDIEASVGIIAESFPRQRPQPDRSIPGEMASQFTAGLMGDLPRGIGGVAQMAGDMFPESEIAQTVGRLGGAYASAGESVGRALPPSDPGELTGRSIAGGVSRATPQIVGQAGLAWATGGGSVPAQLAIFGGTAAAPVVGQQYRDALAYYEVNHPDMDPQEMQERARTEAGAAGLITAGTSILPGLAMLQRVPGASTVLSNAASRVIQSAAGEGIQEMSEQVLTDTVASIVREDPQLWQQIRSLNPEYWDGVLHAGLIGALTGGAVRGGVEALGRQAQEQADTKPHLTSEPVPLSTLDSESEPLEGRFSVPSSTPGAGVREQSALERQKEPPTSSSRQGAIVETESGQVASSQESSDASPIDIQTPTPKRKPQSQSGSTSPNPITRSADEPSPQGPRTTKAELLASKAEVEKSQGKRYADKMANQRFRLLSKNPDEIHEYRVAGYVTRSMKGDKYTLHLVSDTDSKDWRIADTIDVTDQYVKAPSTDISTQTPSKPAPENPKSIERAKDEPSPEGMTSARKVDINRDREALGLNSLDSPERRTWKSVLETAQNEYDKEKVDDFAAELVRKPQAIDDKQTAPLVIRSAELKNEYRELKAKMAATTDPAEIAVLSAEMNRKQDKYDVVSQAMRQSRSAIARGLTFSKATIDEDFDLISVKSRAKAAKGKALTPAESKRFEELTSQLEAKTRQVAALEKRVNEQTAMRAVKQRNRFSKMSKAERDVELEGLKAKALELLRAGCGVN